MAPIKRPRDSSARNRDKPKRRRRMEAGMLYQCLGKLCGEDCEQDIVPVNDSGRRRDEPEDAMDGVSDCSDDEREIGRESRETRGSKHGRVGKLKPKKASASNHQSSELPLKLGVQKAKRYICEALDFGVQSGYLTPKDPKGKVLRVSSDLLQVSEPNKARVLQRVASDGLEPRPERKSARKRAHHDGAVCDGLCSEHHEVPLDVVDSHGKARGARKHRSRSRQGKKRGATHSAARSRSRSKSKSKRRPAVGGRKKATLPRSTRQANSTPESRPAKQLKPDTEEQDEMAESQTESRSGNRNVDNDDDGKSVKSAKSAKSTLNSDSQNTNEEKKHDDDASNYEASDDEDDNKK